MTSPIADRVAAPAGPAKAARAVRLAHQAIAPAALKSVNLRHGISAAPAVSGVRYRATGTQRATNTAGSP